MRHIPKPPLPEDLKKECRTKLLSSVAELTGQSSSLKAGEIANIDTPRELCSEHQEGANEKTSRVTGVSSNGEFWVLHVLEIIRKLEGMSKNVHIAFPVDGEDESGNKSTNKAQETLKKLKTVCQISVVDVIWSLTVFVDG